MSSGNMISSDTALCSTQKKVESTAGWAWSSRGVVVWAVVLVAVVAEQVLLLRFAEQLRHDLLLCRAKLFLAGDNNLGGQETTHELR